MSHPIDEHDQRLADVKATDDAVSPMQSCVWFDGKWTVTAEIMDGPLYSTEGATPTEALRKMIDTLRDECVTFQEEGFKEGEAYAAENHKAPRAGMRGAP